MNSESIDIENMYRIGASIIVQPTELLSVNISDVNFGNPLVNIVRKFFGLSIPDVVVVINGNYGRNQ